MPANTRTKRVFWFDDRKRPNVADVLEKAEDFTVFRLSFDAPEENNWTVMETCHAYCITSTRGEVPEFDIPVLIPMGSGQHRQRL